MGTGSALAAMAVFPFIVSAFKPLTKELDKEKLKDRMKQFYAENKEEFDDLVTIVKVEVEEDE